MRVGQKIRVWGYRSQILQFLVTASHILTITDKGPDGKVTGQIEDGTIYTYNSGEWVASSDEGEEYILHTAYAFWNQTMSRNRKGMRIIHYPSGETAVPDGDVTKCKDHNRYYISDETCSACKVHALLRRA